MGVPAEGPPSVLMAIAIAHAFTPLAMQRCLRDAIARGRHYTLKRISDKLCAGAPVGLCADALSAWAGTLCDSDVVGSRIVFWGQCCEMNDSGREISMPGRVVLKTSGPGVELHGESVRNFPSRKHRQGIRRALGGVCVLSPRRDMQSLLKKLHGY